MKRTSRKILIAASIVALLLAAFLWGCGAAERAPAPGKAAAPVTAQPEGQTALPAEAPPAEEAPAETPQGEAPAPAAARPEQAEAETQGGAGEEAEESDSRLTCTVSIRCDTLLSN
ncbi:MAG TPA: hypothetical protein VN369_02825, partial [Terriglobales bacterium]|nr:hypothetical protein [Terriglobales bacterium]